MSLCFSRAWSSVTPDSSVSGQLVHRSAQPASRQLFAQRDQAMASGSPALARPAIWRDSSAASAPLSLPPGPFGPHESDIPSSAHRVGIVGIVRTVHSLVSATAILIASRHRQFPQQVGERHKQREPIKQGRTRADRDHQDRGQEHRQLLGLILARLR